MKTVQIVIIVIFIIFLIIHISLVSTSNLDIDIKEYMDDTTKKCNHLVEQKQDIQVFYGCSITTIQNKLNQRSNQIMMINIIGVIIGILLGVIQINYINKLTINNNIKIITHTLIIIIYLILIIIGSVVFDDDGYLINKISTIINWHNIQINNPTENILNILNLKTNNIRVGLKPIVPFLGALAISSLSIIVITGEEMNSKSISDYSSISSESI